MIDNEALEAALAELDELGGLKGPKEEIKKLVGMARIMELRAERGLPAVRLPRAMLFLGNPGTGKSRVAMILGKILAALGQLSLGHLVETDRGELVAGYVGQTAQKTQKVVDKARGGVLLIDAADNLYRGNPSDFGIEAVNVIYQVLSDPDEDIFVIFAGYEEPIEEFVQRLPNLDAKIRVRLLFEDLTSDEMFDVFEKMASKHKFRMNDDACKAARTFFDLMCENKDKCFGNARHVRSVFEAVLARKLEKLFLDGGLTAGTVVTLGREDIPVYKNKFNCLSWQIGD